MELKNSTLDDISSVIGFSATMRLAAWFGDEWVYVPAAAEEGHPLVKLVGMPAAKALSKEWGSKQIAVPRLVQYKIDLDRQRIARMSEMGFAIPEISRLLNVGKGRVRQLCTEMEKAGLIKNSARKYQQKHPEKSPQESPQESPHENPAEKAPQESPPRKSSPEKAPRALPAGFFGKSAAPKTGNDRPSSV